MINNRDNLINLKNLQVKYDQILLPESFEKEVLVPSAEKIIKITKSKNVVPGYMRELEKNVTRVIDKQTKDKLNGAY